MPKWTHVLLCTWLRRFFGKPSWKTAFGTNFHISSLDVVHDDLKQQTIKLWKLFGYSIDAAQQRMALNFELVVSDQLFSVVSAAYKWFKIRTPGVRRRHMWQLDSCSESTHTRKREEERKNLLKKSWLWNWQSKFTRNWIS